MKKYTLVTSDTEDNGSNKETNCSNIYQSSNFPQGEISSAAPLTDLPQSSDSKGYNSRQNNTISKEYKDTSIEEITSKKNHTEIRVPCVKSQEEINYWVMTGKSPCMYYYKNDTCDSSGYKSFKLNKFGFDHSSTVSDSDRDIDHKGFPKLCKKSSSSTSSYTPTFLKQSILYNNRNTHRGNRKIVYPMKENAINEDYTKQPSELLKNSCFKKSFSKSPSMSTSEELLVAICDEYKANNFKSLKRNNSVSINQFDKDVSKQKILKTKTTEPLDDYDSCSSVLTANYIKYVNNKQAKNIKQGKMLHLKTKHPKSDIKNASFQESTKLFKRCGKNKSQNNCENKNLNSQFFKSSDKNGLNLKSQMVKEQLVDPIIEPAIGRYKKKYDENSFQSVYKLSKNQNEKIFDSGEKYFTPGCNAKKYPRNLSQQNSSEKYYSFENETNAENTYFSPVNNHMNGSRNCRSNSVSYTKIETVQYTSDEIQHSYVERKGVLHFSKESISSNSLTTLKTIEKVSLFHVS